MIEPQDLFIAPDQQEKKDMEYAFMYNPQNEFSYQIKDMTLHIKKIKQF